jgi:hypothetical protein
MAKTKLPGSETGEAFLEPAEWLKWASMEYRLASGETLSYEENRDYKRLSTKRNEAIFQAACKSLPKRYWSLWSGRDTRSLINQAATYGIPVGEPTVSLPDLAKWVHDFIAENGRRFNAMEEGGVSSQSSPALERYREAKAEREEYMLARDKRVLVERGVVNDLLMRVASRFREFGDVLQRQFGRDAASLFNEHLDDMEREAEGAIVALAAGDDGDSK